MDNNTISKEDLEQVVEDNLDEIINIIKDTYPDIDIFNRIRYTDLKEVKKIVEDVKSKNPGTKLFYVDIPYYGVVIYRSQTLRDMREVSAIGVKHTEKLIEDNGGYDRINKLDEYERIKLQKSITDETNDIIHIEMLKRVVLHPPKFAEDAKNEDIPYGVIPTLIDVLQDVS